MVSLHGWSCGSGFLVVLQRVPADPESRVRLQKRERRPDDGRELRILLAEARDGLGRVRVAVRHAERRLGRLVDDARVELHALVDELLVHLMRDGA